MQSRSVPRFSTVRLEDGIDGPVYGARCLLQSFCWRSISSYMAEGSSAMLLRAL